MLMSHIFGALSNDVSVSAPFVQSDKTSEHVRDTHLLLKFKWDGNVKFCLAETDVSQFSGQCQRCLCFLTLEALELKLRNRLSYRLAFEVQMSCKCQIMTVLN